MDTNRIPYTYKSLSVDGKIVGTMEIFWLNNSVRFRFNEDEYLKNLFENLEFEIGDIKRK